jgi:prefoldin beta subunit
VFVRQDHVEATSNVKKRLEYIGSEAKRLDEKMSLMEEKLGKKQTRIVQLQNEVTQT